MDTGAGVDEGGTGDGEAVDDTNRAFFTVSTVGCGAGCCTVEGTEDDEVATPGGGNELIKL